jgi:hypothetical protein
VPAIMKRPGIGRSIRCTVVAMLLGSYPLLLVAAAIGTSRGGRILFTAAAVACYVGEFAAPRTVPRLVDQLNWLQVNSGLRAVIRQGAVLILLARATDVDPPQFAIVAIGFLALHAIRAAYSAMVIYVLRCRHLPALTRNVDLGELRIPDAPPRLLTSNHSWKLLFLDMPAMAGGILTAATANYDWVLAGLATGLVAGCAGCVIMYMHCRRNRHLGRKARVLSVVNAQVRKHRPEVALYFAGTHDEIYQANMWLPTLARLNRPAVIIMRERSLMQSLGRTSVPVVCIDDPGELTNFGLPTIRAVLYASNHARNAHMLRGRGMGHVFVGHGDSDKGASSSPFSKVYDQIWVAGQAGKDRYLRARVGVRAESVREVGRPQLADLSEGTGAAADPASQAGLITVLYAPTWEGWESGNGPMSTISMGPQIVRSLVSHDRIRVLYRPHPLTGTHNPRAGMAHREITAILAEANRARGVEPAASNGTARQGTAPIAADMARIEARLDAMSGAAKPPVDPLRHGLPDYAGMSRDAAADAGSDEEWQRLTEAWHELYWRCEPAGQHRVMSAALPTLYESFNHCDLMISDISSVVSDFIATGKPYVVTNPAALTAAEFKAANPSASAAYLLSPDCSELTEILHLVLDAGEDSLGAERTRLRNYLLGPITPDAQTRFNDAVAALIAEFSSPAPPYQIDLTGQLGEPRPLAGQATP